MRLSVPQAQHQTLQCMPLGCIVTSPECSHYCPHTLSPVACPGGHLPVSAASGKHWACSAKGNEASFLSPTPDRQRHKNLLFICKKLFPLPSHTPISCLLTSDSPPTCTPKEEAMIAAELDNITSLMPRKPLVCLLRLSWGSCSPGSGRMSHMGGFLLLRAPMGRTEILQVGRDVSITTLGRCR